MFRTLIVHFSNKGVGRISPTTNHSSNTNPQIRARAVSGLAFLTILASLFVIGVEIQASGYTREDLDQFARVAADLTFHEFLTKGTDVKDGDIRATILAQFPPGSLDGLEEDDFDHLADTYKGRINDNFTNTRHSYDDYEVRDICNHAGKLFKQILKTRNG